MSKSVFLVVVVLDTVPTYDAGPFQTSTSGRMYKKVILMHVLVVPAMLAYR